MSIQTLNVSSPPLIWDNINNAFNIINQNFAELDVNFSAAGLIPLNLSSVSVDITPLADDIVSLGSSTNTWKSLYTATWGESLANMNNGIWLGSAQIRGYDSHIDIPANSTIGGQPIIDTTKTTFKNITIPGQTQISAGSINDTLTISSNGSIGFITYPNTNVLEIYNNGVLTITPGTGLSASSNTGNVTLINTGVLSVASGNGISLNTTTGNVVVSNAGVISIVTANGSGLSSSFNSTTGAVTLTNSGILSITSGNGISVSTTSGTSTITNSGILSITSGTGISVSTTSGTSTITNSGILSITSGTGISVSTTSGTSTITNSGILSITPGTGISVSTASGISTISGTCNSFNSIAVSGQTTVSTSSINDTLTIVAGSGISISTSTKQLSFSVTDIIKSSSINISSTGSTVAISSINGLTLTNNRKSWIIDNNGYLVMPNGGDIRNSVTGLSVIPVGLSNRANFTATTASIANNTTAVLAVAGYNTYILYSVTTSVPATVKIYNNASNASVGGASGLIYTAVTTAGNLTVSVLPGIIGYVDTGSISTTPYIQTLVLNSSGTSVAVNVTLTVLRLEI